MPEFLTETPIDPFTGDSLYYERASDGGFTVYSVGPNGMDDEGITSQENWEQDDISWWSLPPRDE